MCGIVCALDLKRDVQEMRAKVVERGRMLRHRGPDWSGSFADEHAVMAHERLAIVDTENGAQPLRDPQTGAALAVNGEIYNHLELRRRLSNYPFQTGSDCEPILYLYRERGVELLHDLDGSFAFVLYDPQRRDYLIARDHIGIVPLFWGKDADGQRWVASELKALVGVCEDIEEFPPGSYFLGSEGKVRRYYEPEWRDDSFDAFLPFDAERPAPRAGARGHAPNDVRRTLRSFDFRGDRFFDRFVNRDETRGSASGDRRTVTRVVAASALVLHRSGWGSGPREGQTRGRCNRGGTSPGALHP